MERPLHISCSARGVLEHGEAYRIQEQCYYLFALVSSYIRRTSRSHAHAHTQYNIAIRHPRLCLVSSKGSKSSMAKRDAPSIKHHIAKRF